MSPQVHDEHLTIRLPSTLKQRLDRVHEQTRIPLSELVRFALSTTLDEYSDRRGKLQRERLVQDLVEDRRDRGLSQGKRAKDNAAA